jgi:hypothetical protein
VPGDGDVAIAPTHDGDGRFSAGSHDVSSFVQRISKSRSSVRQPGRFSANNRIASVRFESGNSNTIRSSDRAYRSCCGAPVRFVQWSSRDRRRPTRPERFVR